MYGEYEEIQTFLKTHKNIEYLDVFVFDLCGNAIGKRLPIEQAKSLYEFGTPICGAMQLVDVMGNTADPLGHGFSDGDPDALAKPLPGMLMTVPWSNGRGAQLLAELTNSNDGQPLWYDPRKVLEAVCDRFKELKLKPVVALELEFYLISKERGPDGSPEPCNSPVNGRAEEQGKVLSLSKLEEFQPILDAMKSNALLQGIPVTTMISEYGAGQFEINLQHQSDPIAAADHAALLRRVVTATALQFDMEATFMSKPFPDQSGSGLHVHVSLLNESGENIFSLERPDGESFLSQAVAGMQATMAEAMAVFAPNFNVYRRFKPDEFTPVTTDWGENNRSVAFRLPPTADPKARRVEHRVSGAEANPYLVTAAVLAGIHYGIDNKLTANDKHSGNAGSAVDPTLPLSIWDALSAWDSSTIILNYFGKNYIQIYGEVKRAEFEAFLEGHFPREFEWYL